MFYYLKKEIIFAELSYGESEADGRQQRQPRGDGQDLPGAVRAGQEAAGAAEAGLQADPLPHGRG